MYGRNEMIARHQFDKNLLHSYHTGTRPVLSRDIIVLLNDWMVKYTIMVMLNDYAPTIFP